jgi:hypothetical protein
MEETRASSERIWSLDSAIATIRSSIIDTTKTMIRGLANHHAIHTHTLAFAVIDIVIAFQCHFQKGGRTR